MLHHRPLQYFQVHSYALLYFPTSCFVSLPVTFPRPNVVLIFLTVLPLTAHSHPFPSYLCGRRHRDHHHPILTSCSIAESSGDLTVNIGIIVFLPRTLPLGWRLLLTAFYFSFSLHLSSIFLNHGFRHSCGNRVKLYLSDSWYVQSIFII